MEIIPDPASQALTEFKTRASLLLKDLRSEDPSRVRAAARRFCVLYDRTDVSPEKVVSNRQSLQRKHALAVVAVEAGYGSWLELRRALAAVAPAVVDTEAFFRCTATGFLNHWFSAYGEAAAFRNESGGYLFPYRRQFVVCGGHLLEVLSLDPDDPDWKQIGFDWVAPLDQVAYLRLKAKLIAMGYGQRLRQ